MSILQFSCQVDVVIVVDVKWLKSPKVARVDPDAARADLPPAHGLDPQVVSAKIGKSWEW